MGDIRLIIKSTTQTNEENTTTSYSTDNYYPPITIITKKNGFVQYFPLSFEKKLVQYNIKVSQEVYENEKPGRVWLNIYIDDSKNIIKNRFEILDL